MRVMIIIIYFREMLTDGQWLTIHLKKVVNNSFKESFYRKRKKTINVLYVIEFQFMAPTL